MKKKTQKLIGLVMAAAVAASMLAGCSQKLSGTVATDGSTSMEKVIGALGEAFMEQNDGVTFTYNPTGSGSGIKAVQEGRCDIGLSSRNLKDEETASGLTATVLAYDGIAVIVHPDNPVADLDVETIAKLYTGEITNWKDVGGDDAQVVLIGREAGSGTRGAFEELLGVTDRCDYTNEYGSSGDVVGNVSGNPNAIGYASLASVNDSVKTMSVEGIMPSDETILSGEYKIQRNFVFVTKKDEELTGSAKDFFDFCMSSEADEYIRKVGAVPIAK